MKILIDWNEEETKRFRVPIECMEVSGSNINWKRAKEKEKRANFLVLPGTRCGAQEIREFASL